MSAPAIDFVSSDIPSAVQDSVRAYVAHQSTLELVVMSGLRRTPPRLVVDVVKQDEYTQDVVLPFQDGLFLVYDTT